MTELDPEDPDRVGELMQRAGRRLEPPEITRAAVYGATHQAWRRQLRQRVHRRQLAVAASVLGFAVLAGLVWLQQGSVFPAQRAAYVADVSGDVQVREDSGAGTATQVTRANGFRAGEQIQTGTAGRLTLRRPGGILIHIAGASELVWQSADALRLKHGLIYIDTQDANGGDALEVITHTGRIRHVGTRFSVQVADLEVRVMVRDGAVNIRDSRAQQRLESGYEARIAADGQLRAMPLAPGEGPWHWLATDQPEFVVDGRSLHAVLQDMAQAGGIPLSYGSPAIEASARELVLHGPALAMPAEPAIDAVLLTTQFARRGALEVVARP